MMKQKKPYFITFEGPDGAGKTTQIRKVALYLQNKGIPLLLTREPGGSVGAEEIRSLLVLGDKNRWDAVTETLLFMAARRDHLTKTIWPALQHGEWVLSDRFFDSTLAYQGFGRGENKDISFNDLKSLYRLVAGDFLPDLTVILDLPVEEGLNRAKLRADKAERFESMPLAFHENLRQGFLKIAENEPERCVVINADRTEEEIFEHIKEVLKERLNV